MNRLIFLFFLCIVICSGSISQKRRDMANSLQNLGEFIDYNILPIEKRVQFLLIKNKVDFEKLLSKFDAKPIILTDSFDDDEFIKYPFYYRKIALSKINRLSNGLYAVDQSEPAMANPYYLCESLDDFRMIQKYLSVFKITDSYKTNRTIVKCFIPGDGHLIARFLSSPTLRLIEHNLSIGEKVFVSADGKAVRVRYSLKKQKVSGAVGHASNIAVDKIANEDSLDYYDLVIYPSFKIMNMLGENIDYPEIDETNFSGYSKNILLRQHKIAKVVVLTATDYNQFKRTKKTRSLKSELPDYFKDATVLTENGKCILQCSKELFIQFENHSDFSDFIAKVSENRSDYMEVPNFQQLSDRLQTEVAYTSDPTGLEFRISPINEHAEESLKAFDNTINRYFFDNKFIKDYFPQIAREIGNAIIRKEGGNWIYDIHSNRRIIKTRLGVTVDFTPYLFEEMLNQKYTGFCSAEAIIDGVTFGAKLGSELR
jgi:hypothetical protein